MSVIYQLILAIVTISIGNIIAKAMFSRLVCTLQSIEYENLKLLRTQALINIMEHATSSLVIQFRKTWDKFPFNLLVTNSVGHSQQRRKMARVRSENSFQGNQVKIMTP